MELESLDFAFLHFAIHIDYFNDRKRVTKMGEEIRVITRYAYLKIWIGMGLLWS